MLLPGLFCLRCEKNKHLKLQRCNGQKYVETNSGASDVVALDLEGEVQK